MCLRRTKYVKRVRKETLERFETRSSKSHSRVKYLAASEMNPSIDGMFPILSKLRRLPWLIDLTLKPRLFIALLIAEINFADNESFYERFYRFKVELDFRLVLLRCKKLENFWKNVKRRFVFARFLQTSVR